jgi:hypothetical protein
MGRQARSIMEETLQASGAVTANRFVGFDGAQITTQGAKVAGVAQYDAGDGEDLATAVIGTAVIESGAAVNVGEGVIADSSGRAIPTTGEIAVESGTTAVQSTSADGTILTGGEMPEHVVADALESASGAGEFIEVLLRRG